MKKTELLQDIYDMISDNIGELRGEVEYVMLAKNNSIVIKMVDSESVFVLNIKEEK